MGGSKPSAPAPIDQAQVAARASAAADQQYKDQLAAQIAAYPQLEALQLGTVNKVSGNLNNKYTGQAKGIIDQTLQQGANALIGTGNQIQYLGGLSQGLGEQAYNFAQGPTAQDRLIANAGASALNTRADQVSMPSQIRNVQSQNANAASIAPIDQVSSRDVVAAQIGNIPSIEAQDARSQSTGAGALGNQLLASAQSRLANNGQLSEEELRNASQGARSAFSARGLGTGAGAAAAEILNRSTYSRQRLNDDSAFASNVQAQDLARRQTNVSSANQFSLANQGVGMQAQLANQQTAYNTGLQNAQFGQAAQLANKDSALRAALANQQAGLSIGQANAGFTQQANLANQQVGMQAQQANQSADQAMNQQILAAQQANQAANMNQLAANRDFLINGNNAVNNSQISRGNYGLGMLGNTANIYGQGGGAYQNAAQLGFGGANALVNLDPYQRALGTGVQLGTGIQGQSGSMIGNTYGQNLQMAGDIASTNYNAQWSAYNSANNNNSAMLGAGIGALGQIGGAAAGGYAMGLGAVAL